ERSSARRVADHCGAEHQAIVFRARDALALMDRGGELLDEPLGDASFLPRYALALAAKQTATVMLSGDGGDALFCGYPTFLAERPAPRLRRAPPARRGAASSCAGGRAVHRARTPSATALREPRFCARRFHARIGVCPKRANPALARGAPAVRAIGSPVRGRPERARSLRPV